MILETGEDEFIFCGLNYQAEPLPRYDDVSDIEIIALEEGRFRDGEWIPGRRLNGDELHISLGDEPMVLKCKLIRHKI